MSNRLIMRSINPCASASAVSAVGHARPTFTVANEMPSITICLLRSMRRKPGMPLAGSEFKSFNFKVQIATHDYPRDYFGGASSLWSQFWASDFIGSM